MGFFYLGYVAYKGFLNIQMLGIIFSVSLTITITEKMRCQAKLGIKRSCGKLCTVNIILESTIPLLIFRTNDFIEFDVEIHFVIHINTVSFFFVAHSLNSVTTSLHLGMDGTEPRWTNDHTPSNPSFG